MSMRKMLKTTVMESWSLASSESGRTVFFSTFQNFGNKVSKS